MHVPLFAVVGTSAFNCLKNSSPKCVERNVIRTVLTQLPSYPPHNHHCTDAVYCEQWTMSSSLTVIGMKHVRARLDDCGIGRCSWPAFESIPRRVTIRTCVKETLFTT